MTNRERVIDLSVKYTGNRERITQLTYENNLSHYGSSLGVYEVLKEIEKVKTPEDIIVLDEAHGAMGYYAWLEEQGVADAQKLFEKHGVHQNRDPENQIWVSGGSLGQAGAVSLGMAIADRQRDVFVIFSDGGFREGIWSECLQTAAKLKINNWKPYLNFNGFSGYEETDYEQIRKQIEGLGHPVKIIKTHVDGLQDHYRKVTEEEYRKSNRPA